jgi:hypothetical protein
LDGQPNILPLPPDGAGAVIFHDKLEPRHASIVPFGTA